MPPDQNKNFFQSFTKWGENKHWWLRLPILVWFGYILRQDWHPPQPGDTLPFNPISAFNLGIHELGHLLFSKFGEFMHVLGGSLFQVLFPVIWLGIFIKKKYYFASSMACCWIGLNFLEVAVYASDARSRLLPLATGLAGIGLGDYDEVAYDQGHDWYQILSRLHHLNSDTAIAHTFWNIGISLFLIGMILGTWLVLVMVYSAFQRKPTY